MKKENAEMPLILERYSDPSEFDYSMYLSIRVNKNDQSAWVQMSKDDESVKWERFECLQDALDFIKNIKKQ